MLLVQHTADLTGSTISGQLVAQALHQAGWQVDVVLGADGPGRAAYEALGRPVRIVPYHNWLRGGNALGSWKRIAAELSASDAFCRTIREVHPALVYVNTLVGLAAAAAARRRKTPCIWHIRELFDDVGGEMKIPPLGGRALVRRVIQSCADQVVVISQAVRDNILGPAWRGAVSVVPNAVDRQFFELAASRDDCRQLLGLPRDRPLVGVPGSLRPMKGHEFLLEAAAAIAATGPDCQFVVTGDGEPRYVQYLQSRVAALGLASRLTFTGTLNRMPEFYRACDLVCVPSRAEPFGRTVIEAFAAGVPVVASAVGGIRETVRHDQTGLLVEFGDTEALAGAIRRLLNEPQTRGRLAAEAQQEARGRYSAETYFERIPRIVEEVLGRRTPA